MGLKIVGYAADAILQMLGAKINQEPSRKLFSLSWVKAAPVNGKQGFD